MKAKYPQVFGSMLSLTFHLFSVLLSVASILLWAVIPVLASPKPLTDAVFVPNKNLEESVFYTSTGESSFFMGKGKPIVVNLKGNNIFTKHKPALVESTPENTLCAEGPIGCYYYDIEQSTNKVAKEVPKDKVAKLEQELKETKEELSKIKMRQALKANLFSLSAGLGMSANVTNTSPIITVGIGYRRLLNKNLSIALGASSYFVNFDQPAAKPVVRAPTFLIRPRIDYYFDRLKNGLILGVEVGSWIGISPATTNYYSASQVPSTGESLGATLTRFDVYVTGSISYEFFNSRVLAYLYAGPFVGGRALNQAVVTSFVRTGILVGGGIYVKIYKHIAFMLECINFTTWSFDGSSGSYHFIANNTFSPPLDILLNAKIIFSYAF